MNNFLSTNPTTLILSSLVSEFDNASKSEDFFFLGGGGGGLGGGELRWREGGFQTEKKTICIHLTFCAANIYRIQSKVILTLILNNILNFRILAQAMV